MTVGAFTLTTARGATNGGGGSSGTLVYGKNGVIPFFGQYIENKFNTSSGLVVFFPTADGTINGDPIFQEILGIETDVIFQGDTSKQPVSSIHQVINNQSVVVKLIRGASTYSAPGESNPTTIPFTNELASVQILVSGRLKPEYYISPTATYSENRFSLQPSANKAPLGNGEGKIDSAWLNIAEISSLLESAGGGARYDSSSTQISYSNTEIYSYDALAYRSAKALIQVVDGGVVSVTELLITHDFNAVTYTEFGRLTNTTEVLSITAELINGRVVIIGTLINTDNVNVRLQITLLPI